LAKILTLVGIHPLISLILISNLALLVALVIFLEEVKDYLGKAFMLPTSLVLLTFPGAFFFYAPFPMSLTLLLVLFSFRLVRRERLLAASAAGFLSGLAHSTVIPLTILLFITAYSNWKKTGEKLRWSSLLVPLAPLAGVGFFVAWRAWEGFPPLSKVLGDLWGSSLFNPMAALGQLVLSIVAGNPLSILKVFIIVIGTAAILWLLVRKQYSLGIYQSGLLLYLVSFTVPDHPLGSFIRYFLLSFPVFMALGIWLKPRRWLTLLGIIVLGVVNLLLCSLYLSWFFVA
jgi:hypothetical protein